MNKTYRSIWNAVTNTWTAAAETAKSHSKGSARTARQAVMAIALGSASIGGAMAAEVCTAEDGSSGTVDATGVCTAAGAGAMSTLGTIGTMAADDTTYVKVNSTGPAASASGVNTVAIGQAAISAGASSVAIGAGATSAGTGSTAIGQAATVVSGANSAMALGANAQTASSSSTAIGADSSAAGGFSIALGRLATATNSSSISIGSNSTASTNYSVALGGATAGGRGAVVTGARSVAIGTLTSASATDAVALGYGAVADRANTVSVGAGVPNADGNQFTRQIVNVAAGTEDNDAVNLGQMNAGLSTTNASIAATNSALSATNATLSTTNTTLAATNTALSTTNSQVASLEGGLSTANTNIATHASEITTINDKLSELSNGTVGLIQQASAGADLTVGANTDGGAVNFAGMAGERKLTGIAAGTADTDAVNVGQMNAGLSTTNAAIAATNAELSTTNTTLASTNTALSTTNSQVASLESGLSTANTNIATHTSEITTINDKLNELSSGTVGLVQQASAGDDITVGANTDGNAVNFTGTAGARRLTGIAAGDISAASTEAVNGAQLHGVSDSVASAIGGGSTVNPDGSISAPSFTVGDGSGGTKLVNSVGDVVTNLDGRTTTNEGDIRKLADDIGSGTLGLVQQANPGDDITVGANTDGNAVNFTGTAGARRLTGVAAGDISAASTEAVNGAQLHGVSDSVASAIGGGSTVNPDGSISAPRFTVGDGSGGTKIVNSVGDVVTNLDERVTSNEGGIKKLSEQLESGELGLVQQNPSTGMITVGATTGGTSVNFAGTAGARVLSGVANGVDDDDAVTVSQLRATGLIDYTGKEVGAVTYDSGLNFDTVTFAGTFGTKLQRVAAGEISATSMDAVNGSQLFDLQEQFAKQYGDLSGQFGDLSSRFGDLSDRLGDLEANPGTGGPGTGDGSTIIGEGAVASGENSSAIGESSLASGENASAVGQGAVASGSNGSAIGQGSTASGSNGSAIGQGAVASGSNGSAIGQGAIASGENSTSLGQGASATGSGSVAIGQGSVATEANTVSFGNGTEEGNRRLVNIADGINASDAATKGQLDRAMESVDARFNDTNRAINDVAKNAYAGIAAAMAMPNMTPSQPGKTVVAVGAANFKSGSAIAAGATYRSRSGNWLVNGATSITSVGDVGVRAQVGYEF
nr:ESPR-type extended signal peptide-containing protein [Burkholderia sp. MSMB1072]